MPEAPELEIIKRELKEQVVGRQIIDIRTGPPALFSPNPKLIKEYLQGKIIEDIKRYGKFLIFSFDNTYNIGIHFGVGGSLLYREKDKERGYVFFVGLDDGKVLFFKDLEYGKILLFENEGLYKDLGPDIMDKDLFTEEYLTKVVKGKNKYIKLLLMDQKLISGLGNTYTDEILYRAKIHPKRKAKTLEQKEISNLYYYIDNVIREAISLGGNSEDGFLDIYGNKGMVQDKLIIVHHRMGRACPLCGAKIEKIKLGGRDTYFCPICQI